MKRLKQIISVVLVAAILSSYFTVPLIYLDFGIRKDYITNVLCINQDQPALQCNGKCYLSERLNKAKDQREKQTQDILNEVVIELFFQSEFQDSTGHPPIKREEIQRIVSVFGTMPGVLDDVFHPPQV